MLRAQHINFSFPKARYAKKGTAAPPKTLQDISFDINAGRQVAVLGESGCGKSTLLEVTYGLLQAQEGALYWEDQLLLGPDHHLIPGHHMMKYVPQEFDLMPFTSVYENVGEFLSIQLDDREDRIHELLEVVDMIAFKDRKVATLSGGQKQRVAIAKALAQEPQLLLLDEPFSHIDNFRKNHLRRQLFQYLQQHKIGCLLATHDRDDVLAFCDEVMVMRKGQIIDHRATNEVYRQPRNLYTARLFDEAQIIPASWIGAQEDRIVYPYQLQESRDGFSIRIKKSYDTGRDFLVIGTKDDKEIFLKSDQPLEAGAILNIKIKDEK